MRYAFLVLALAFAPSALAQRVEEQIRAEVRRYVAAINRGDAAGVAALYLDDPRTSTADDGKIHRGWKNIAGILREILARPGAVHMDVDSVVVRRLGNDAAIAVGNYEWWQTSRREAPPARGAITLVYARTRRGWRVVHDHTSTLAREPFGSGRPIHDTGPAAPRRETILSCLVTAITDGDGIECEGTGRVRLIGIDTPELDQDPYGRQAAMALASFVRVGSTVRLEQDVDPRDRYGRLLAYVWVDSTLVNWRMVREGWAVLLTYQPNVQYVDWLIEAERKAREERRALWATGGFDCRPADHRRRECE